MLCSAIFYKKQFMNSVFELSLLSPMDTMTTWLWLIPLGDKKQIPLQLTDIHNGPNFRPDHEHVHNHNHGPYSYSLSSQNPDLRLRHLMHLGYTSTT